TIWCFADLTTGQYVVATPGGAPLPRVAIRPGSLRRAGGLVSQFAFDHSFLDLLYIEPGRAAWVMTAADGGTEDRDGPSGKTAVPVNDFKAVGSRTEKPAELKPGGILVAIDFVRMEVAAERLDAALIGSAQ